MINRRVLLSSSLLLLPSLVPQRRCPASETGWQQLLDKLLDQDETPELAAEEVVHVACGHP